jgi:aryl-alcohol dehydrogenase-like predicted oxidoreductase
MTSGLLPTTVFGQTEMKLTAVGMGCWAIGGPWIYGWGRQSDDDSVRSIIHAVERGINWLDTAPAYGLGHSEELVGRALRDIPEADRPLVFTKLGLVWDETRPGQPPRRVASPSSIRWELEQSLRRLGVERVDLYQVHWPPEDGTSLEVYWEALKELQAEGKIRAAGLSNHDLGQLQRAERLGHVESLQPPFSAIKRDAAGDLLPWCDASGTGVIVYGAMAHGLLSGRFSEKRFTELAADDWRRADPLFTDQLQRNLELAGLLERIGTEHDTTAGAVAIAWTLAWPGVTGAIVGARSPEQIDGWINAGSLMLSGREIDDIAELLSQRGVGTGPFRPNRGVGTHR